MVHKRKYAMQIKEEKPRETQTLTNKNETTLWELKKQLMFLQDMILKDK